MHHLNTNPSTSLTDINLPKKAIKHVRQLSSAGLNKATSLILVSGSNSNLDKATGNNNQQQQQTNFGSNNSTNCQAQKPPLIKLPSKSNSNGSLTMSANGNGQLDDNNFINNTFSFLDELDNNTDDDLDTRPRADSLLTTIPDHGTYTYQVYMEDHGLITEPVREEQEGSVEELNYSEAMSPIQENPHSVEKQNGRSKTLPSDTPLPEYLNQSKLSAKLSSFSSKTKPIAPKIKSSVTIGVATGVEALRAINCVKPGYSSSSNGDVSDNKKLLQRIKQQQQHQQAEQTMEGKEKAEAPKRPPITRIINSDNHFQNAAPSSGTQQSMAGPGGPTENNRNRLSSLLSMPQSLRRVFFNRQINRTVSEGSGGNL